MAAIGSLVVNLVAETAEFTNGMRRAENDVERLKRQVRSSESAMSAFGAALGRAGSNSDAAVAGVQELYDSLLRISEVESATESYKATVDVTSNALGAYSNALKAASDAQNALLRLGGPAGLALSVALIALAAATKAWTDAQADLNREREKGLALDEKINKFHTDRFQAELDAIKESGKRQKAVIAGARGFGATDEAGLRSQIETFGMSQSEADMHRLRQSMWQWRNDNAAALAELGPAFRAFITGQMEARLKNIGVLQQELDKLREQADATQQTTRAVEEAARAQQQLHKTLADAGRAIRESVMTPLEQYERKLQDIMALEEIGAIDKATADRAAAEARAALERAGGATGGVQKPREQSPGALLFGTAQAFSKEANRNNDTLVKLAERQVAVQEKNLPALGRLADNAQRVGVFSIS